MNRPARITLKIAGALLALFGIAALALLAILPSEWLEAKVRDRIVYEVERVSGGRVEIGRFHFDWKTLTAEVAPFVLHGREPAGEAPLVQADSVRVGLKIISLMEKRVDLASATVLRPKVNILVDANGRLNLPEPKLPRSGKTDPIQLILSLKIKRLTVEQGLVHFGNQSIPLDIRGENIHTDLSYDTTGPRYYGSLAMDDLRIESAKRIALGFHMESKIVLEKSRVHFESGRLSMPKSVVDFSGEIDNLRDPRIAIDVKAEGELAELAKPLDMTEPKSGHVTFAGKLTYTAADSLLVAGNVIGKGLVIDENGIRISGIGVKSAVQLRLHEVVLRGTEVTALGGKFTGQAELKDFRRYSAKGTVAGISVQEVSRTAGVKGVAWNGLASGPVEVRGSFVRGARDFKGSGQFDVVPADGGIPISGHVDAVYDRQAQRLDLGQSYLKTAATALNFTGTLGEHLAVRLESGDLNDLLPALAMTSENAPLTLPLQLNAGGNASFEGSVDGKLDAAEISGNAVLNKFSSQGQSFETLTANVAANPSGLRVRTFILTQDALALDGSLNVGLQNWKLVDASALSGTMRLRGARIEKLLADAGQKVPVTGALSGSITVRGTYGSPQAVMQALVDKPTAYGEKYDRLRAEVRYSTDSVEIANGVLEQGAAQVSISGSYRHPANDFQNGTVLFDAGTRGFTLEQVRTVQDYRPGMKGRFTLRLTGGARVEKAKPQLNNLNGQFAVQDLVVDNTALGNFVLDASTASGRLTLGASGELRGSVLKGNGVFELAGDYPGSGQVEFSRMTVATIQDLFRPKGKDPFPIDGFVEGKLTFSGPALKPELMTARMELPKVELFSTQKANLGKKQAQDLTLRNAGPIVAVADSKGIHLVSGHLVGRESNIEASGTLNLKDAKNPYDFRVNGDVNLAILQEYQPGLLATGHSAVNATVRGSFDQPVISGRLELKNATFYLEDFPNGIDQANGMVIFDRNRATISDKLTALTGGGVIALTGFVGFGKGEIVYRLQGRADNVRYRGDGVSTTGNANVSLTGTSTHALLAGTVTIVKAGFNPKADLGSLLLATSVPIATPTTPNQFLRGLQLDIHVETVPNLQFMTSVTSDLQAEADLRIRGIAVRPVLSGQISVNQGDVQFFGNKYSINRGNIAFYNTTKIEPVLDMDLETQVRGVVVNINFSGPINKLNLSYRSDPPLQSNEIIALLAVGRAPGTNSSLASSQTVSQQSSLSSSTNSLLGQAIAAPISGRLQRFFGVSRLKIDPLLTGVNAVPQARLTLEQQISKDITLTYVTNLAQANQQLVKVEWNVNRNWSAVAIREENGVFGIDFLYKKRFK